MRNKSSILILLCALMFCSPVFAVDISGEWQIKMYNTMGVEDTYDTKIKVNGESLEIAIKHPQYGDLKGTGVLKGDKITVEFSLQGGDGAQGFKLEGEVKGDKMEGTRKVVSAVDPSAMMSGGIGSGAPNGGGSDAGAPPGNAGGTPGGMTGSAGSGGAPPSGGNAGGSGSFAASHLAKFPDSKFLPGQEPNTWTAVKK